MIPRRKQPGINSAQLRLISPQDLIQALLELIPLLAHPEEAILSRGFKEDLERNSISRICLVLLLVVLVAEEEGILLSKKKSLLARISRCKPTFLSWMPPRGPLRRST